MRAGKLIGLIGYLRSGKTIAAETLVSLGYVRWRMAQGLKDMLYALGIDKDYLDGAKKEEPLELLSGRTARHAMQTLGTEWARHQMHPNFWTNIMKVKLERLPALDVVIDDIRFPNEATMIQELGGVLWRIDRSELEPDTTHESESYIASLPYDLVIKNDGIELLKLRVTDAAQRR